MRKGDWGHWFFFTIAMFLPLLVLMLFIAPIHPGTEGAVPTYAQTEAEYTHEASGVRFRPLPGIYAYLGYEDPACDLILVTEVDINFHKDPTPNWQPASSIIEICPPATTIIIERWPQEGPDDSRQATGRVGH